MPVGQRREDGIKPLLIPALVKNLLASKLVNLLKYLSVGDQIPPHGDKGVHNANAHTYCSWAMQHGRQHRNPLLGEHFWQLANAAPT